MRSIVFERFGEPEGVLQLRQVERPTLQSGEILVRMHARPINPSDLIPVRGAYRHRTHLPGVPGYEGVGVVAATADDVTAPAVGTRVLPLCGAGTWQEYVCSPAAYAIPVPAAISDEAACQLYINPLTAWLILTDMLCLERGDVLVVNAGGSAFAHVLLQFARVLGLRVILVTRRALHSERLMALGAHAVIDTSAEVMHARVMALTQGNGAAAVLDAIGGAAGAELTRCVRSGGRFVYYGLLSGQPLALSHAQIQARGLSVHGFWLKHWLDRVSPVCFRSTFDSILPLVESGQVTFMPAAHSRDLEQIVEAVQLTQQPGRNGKVLLTG